MKQLILTMSLLALISCKDNKQNASETHDENHETHTEATHNQHQDNDATTDDNMWMKDIQLNNGEKWEANSETNEGVKRMQAILKAQQTITIDDYHKLAEQLSEAKNYVVKECTMKGASHDNLHVWLVPLIEKIEVLSETKILEDAAKIKHSITENINSYNNYFK